MPGVTVDGQDVLAVRGAAEEAVRRARSGGGPSLVECMTYRYHGHHQGDDTLRYRTADEEKAARDRDCLRLFREVLLARGFEAAALDALDDRNRERLDEAVAFAEAGPLPGPEELLAGVYAGEVQR
jgi:pyruvate dehydrogenase E1 component alpha subunit